MRRLDDIANFYRSGCCFFASVALAAAQFAGPSVDHSAASFSAPSVSNAESARDAKILPGDTISLTTLGAPELTIPSIRVTPAGEIGLPFVGSIKVAGETGAAVASSLAAKLKKAGLLVEPQVTLQLTESPSRIITVVGEVRQPRPVTALSTFHLLDVISACGGFTASASHTLTVQRQDPAETLTVRLSIDPRMSDETNLVLLPGDTVIVPKVGSVFIVGQVRTEQAIALEGNEPITVMRAIAMAGGLKYGASLSRARIVRGTDPANRKEVGLDLKKIMDGKQADPVLLANDILYVPTNAVKAGLSNGGAAVAATSIYGLGSLVK